MTTVLNKREWSLKKETEIRCEVADGATLRIKLLTGTAEIFGVELAPNKEYTFRDQNVAIFTWYGCTLESSGDDAGLYIADSTPMIAYVNTHVQLEARRDVAVANKDAGPRVCLCIIHNAFCIDEYDPTRFLSSVTRCYWWDRQTTANQQLHKYSQHMLCDWIVHHFTWIWMLAKVLLAFPVALARYHSRNRLCVLR